MQRAFTRPRHANSIASERSRSVTVLDGLGRLACFAFFIYYLTQPMQRLRRHFAFPITRGFVHRFVIGRPTPKSQCQQPSRLCAARDSQPSPDPSRRDRWFWGPHPVQATIKIPRALVYVRSPLITYTGLLPSHSFFSSVSVDSELNFQYGASSGTRRNDVLLSFFR